MIEDVLARIFFRRKTLHLAACTPNSNINVSLNHHTVLPAQLLLVVVGQIIHVNVILAPVL
jgi:hypothetical protein